MSPASPASPALVGRLFTRGATRLHHGSEDLTSVTLIIGKCAMYFAGLFKMSLKLKIGKKLDSSPQIT